MYNANAHPWCAHASAGDTDSMQFIDEATIVAISGSGGIGSKHFRREKHVPRGGPDGGDGGRGGDVVACADGRSRSLLDYHFARHYTAQDGSPGQGQNKTGQSGADLVLVVPPGTQISDAATGELLADMVHEGQTAVLLKGGNGGWGNAHFATATRQTPDRANPGQPGQTKPLRFELKLLADVALVGMPNAGKSSLIRAISASRAVVADYPFTTLVPNLGVVRHHGRIFTVADIPGLIAGASEGAGLGLRFLRHIERCQLLVFLLSPVDTLPPEQALQMLRAELAAHDPTLLQRPQVVCLGKADLLGPDAASAAADLAATVGQPVLAISPVARTGIDALLDQLAPQFAPAAAASAPAWSPVDPGPPPVAAPRKKKRPQI